ncbi:hypothetical protein [Serratia proteamaculans]|uniref:hypothetical protein n=1 Tax=Serratia proteamaculans TaxID=28151 RepID=UPI0021BB6D4E|nr:hypothetical protein [Serratia proteamaculans]
MKDKNDVPMFKVTNTDGVHLEGNKTTSTLMADVSDTKNLTAKNNISGVTADEPKGIKIFISKNITSITCSIISGVIVITIGYFIKAYLDAS